MSLVLLTLTKDPLLGSIFGVMLAVDYFIFQKLPTKINYNQVPKNTGTAIVAAMVAFGIFFGVTFGVTLFLQSTAFFQGTIDPSNQFQSIMRHGFAATGLSAEKPIFADSKILTYFQFGLVIPIIETRMLIRLLEYLTRSFNVPLTKFSIQLGGVYIFLGWLFVILHSNVKGVEDNVALLMTFIFAIVTFELARRFKEMEAATDLHIINNVVFIANKIGF